MQLRKFVLSCAVLLLIAVVAPISSTGQEITPDLYSGMRWRMIGPFRGGRAVAASGVRGRADLYYFGAVAGGVWKTTNGGQTWTPIFDSQPIASIGSLAVAPSDENLIYAGTGEASIRSDVSFGNGVYKSTDAGKTWQHIGLEDTRHVGRVLVDPKNANVVFVAALGHAYGPNPERGVFRSTDGGKTWKKVLYKDENTGGIDLAFDPADSRVVYATLWNAHRPPWSAYPPIQGPGAGLYKSTDDGDTWKQITGNGLPTAEWGRAGIATCAATVYVLLDTLDGKQGGLYRSDDRGGTWRQVSADKRTYGRQWYFGEVTTDPKNCEIVYVPNVSLYKSVDGGKTFNVLKGAPGGDDYHFLWIDPDNPRQMIVASDQGTQVSMDGGASWSSWFNQPTAQFYHVATDNQFPYYVYGAQQDSGTVATASRSDYGAITYRNWFSVGAGESGYIVPDPVDPSTVYGGSTYGRLYRFDKITGQSLDISPTAVEDWDTPITAKKLRFTWTSPLVFSPQDSHTIYFGSQYVLRSTDRGNSWQEISPDLTGCETARSPTGTNAGVRSPLSAKNEPVTVQNAESRCYGVVYTIAPSPLDANVIWAGTDNGKIWLTRDGGKTWRSVGVSSSEWLDDQALPGARSIALPHSSTSSLVPAWSKISIIEASRFGAGIAYVAIDRHRLDDNSPYIYRTGDFGESWRGITSGLPREIVLSDIEKRTVVYVGRDPRSKAIGPFVRAVREDPKRKGLLYAGTELGVYVSFDDGDHWQSLQLNLPVAPVHDLVVHDDDLVIATHGRSFWILDDLTPLRQITPALKNEGTHLFVPQPAMRVRSDVARDTPLPPETPMGQNPPAGAIIDYYLAQAAKQVTLEILDSSGKAVRKFSSSDPPAPAETVAFPRSWFGEPPVLQTTAGEHRFVWDLRYPAPPVLRHSYDLSAVWGVPLVGLPRGPLALPGEYQVRLDVDGKVLTQPLTVKLDPRLKVSAADLQKQVDLELQISAAMRQAYAVLQRQGKVPPPAQAQASTDTDPLSKTVSHLATLLDVLDTADAAPTQQSQEAWRELRAKLEHLLRVSIGAKPQN
ncbi:MAG: VPS10 domain-containing protein [Terriglobales bacterium]